MQAEGDVIRFPEQASVPVDFSTFFAEEHRGLFKALYFVTGSRADAAELMQDAFLKQGERWDVLDRIDDPTAYPFRVALNGSRMRALAARRAARRLISAGRDRDPFEEILGPRRREARFPKGPGFGLSAASQDAARDAVSTYSVEPASSTGGVSGGTTPAPCSNTTSPSRTSTMIVSPARNSL
jgi:DNA-directed RNA polymerase specialized sigma24 family protein